jgi:NitT/TauT family transport system permease protein/taurine transport system permease protein
MGNLAVRLKEQWIVQNNRFPNFFRLIKLVSSFLPILLIWIILGWLRIWPDYYFPSPVKVYQVGVETIQKGILQKHIVASLERLLVGFIVGGGIGIVLAFLMGINRFCNRFFDPIINFFQSIAGIAWVPLAIIWFGFGFRTTIFVIFNTVFFPVVFNTLMGIRGVPKVLEDAALTMGAKKRQVIFEVLLPGALPSIITGLRIGMGYGWRALIAAEMISSDTGLGFLIFDARNYFKTELVLLGMLTIGIIWIIIDNLFLKPVERRTIERWGLVR